MIVSFNFHNFYSSAGERYICFYSKWRYESFSVGSEVLGLFFLEVISDYGFAQIHPYIFSSIHGNKSDTSLRSLIGAVKRGFLGTKQACPFEVQISTTGFIRTSHYQAEWTNSGNKQLLCKGIIFLLLFEILQEK